MEKDDQKNHAAKSSQSQANSELTSPAARSIPAPTYQLQTNTAQLKEGENDQAGKGASSHVSQGNDGLPNNLKSGIESLSGMPMDDVKVHRNSSQPASLGAHAYAQGTDIHLGAGQEEHLAHEAWHVVQQKQGRVKPTTQLKGKANINDDSSLEKEADMMGAKALQMKASETTAASITTSPVQLKENGVHQLKIKMKDSGPAERTGGPGHLLEQEVAAVIERNELAEIKNDIAKLDRSIENRERDATRYKKYTNEYYSHEARIDLEFRLLGDLKKAKEILQPRKPKKKKKKAKKGQWEHV